ncbi:MAG: hypothetical protein J7621_00100 [Niastella sp.]|nr:hypothetical protein [Niastella sp.]
MKKYTADIKTWIVALMATGSLLLTACHKDKGNYDYTELQDMYVNTASTGRAFIVKQFDTLKLKSNLVYNGDRSKLKYSWSAYFMVPNVNDNLADTLSTSEDLAVPIPYLPSKYYLEFTATDSTTGRRAAVRYEMTVESIGAGLLVLYEKDGKVDCDLIKTKLLEGLTPADEVVRNLYSLANPTVPLTGDALAIGAFNLSDVQYISLYTSNNGVAVSPADMVISKNFKDLFFLAPNTVKPQGYTAPLGFLTNDYEFSAGFEFLVNDGQLYSNMVIFAFGSESAFSLLAPATGNYKISPYPIFGGARIVVYDELSRGFLQGSPLGTTLSPYVSSTQGSPPFNFSNIGKDLIYLSYAFGGTYVCYGVFKNPVDNGARYVYMMDFLTSTARAVMDVSSLPNIAQARLFAFGVRGPLIYYAAGNKVYQIVFDPATGTASQGIDAWPFIPANEEITCIKMCPHPGRNVSESALDKYLMVGTYNNSTGMGKVYMLQANITSGTLQAQPAAVYEQFGKVKDIAFKF